MPSPASNDQDRAIGLRIRARRQELNLRQEELGAITGVAWQSVQKWEKGQSRVSGARLQQLSRALDISISELIGEHTEGADSHVVSFAATSEGAAFIAAIMRIKSSRMRRDLLRMIRTIADEGDNIR